MILTRAKMAELIKPYNDTPQHAAAEPTAKRHWTEVEQDIWIHGPVDNISDTRLLVHVVLGRLSVEVFEFTLARLLLEYDQPKTGGYYFYYSESPSLGSQARKT
jgi:hypothetical protein